MGKYRKYYSTLSLNELRRRQYLTTCQIKMAYDKRQRGLKALIRLQRVHLILSDVVMKKFCNGADK